MNQLKEMIASSLRVNDLFAKINKKQYIIFSSVSGNGQCIYNHSKNNKSFMQNIIVLHIV